MLHTAPTAACDAAFLAALRRFLDAAFDDFTDDDWHHARGGVHVWIDGPDGLVSHAAVIERTLIWHGSTLRTGYVEAVATAETHRRRGHATEVMTAIGELIRERDEIGALSTGTPAFYATLGWELWTGPTFVAAPHGRAPTPDDDGSVMILRTPRTPSIALTDEIACDWRSGEVW